MSEGLLALTVGIPLGLLILVGCALWFGADVNDE